MKYELIESPTNPGHWHVEAFDDAGECIKAVFSGPFAKERAIIYLGDCNSPLSLGTLKYAQSTGRDGYYPVQK